MITVYFSHGKESGPWGTKIVRLAHVAKAANYHVASVDYRGLDTPEDRVRKLLDSVKEPSRSILVGSSMGAYVAAAAAEVVEPIGLFLMAPAFFMLGYESYKIESLSCTVTVIHGWRDEIVPVENSIRFARQHQADLSC